MGKKKNAKNENEPSRERLDEAVYQAACELGWCFPVREEEVDQAEAHLDERGIELPERLQNPQTLWEEWIHSMPFHDAKDSSSKKIIALPGLQTVSEEMARVAREGQNENAFSEDLQNRLRRDRRKAEQEEEDACPS